MLLRLLILFTVVPLVELWLLVEIGGQFGLLATIAIILGTGVIGAALARWQGLLCLRTVQRQLRAGQLPTDAILDGLGILLAAVLLITPGVLSDAVGFCLLIPPVRRVVSRVVVKLVRARFGAFTFTAAAQPPGDDASGASPGRDRIIDVRVINPVDDSRKDRGNSKF